MLDKLREMASRYMPEFGRGSQFKDVTHNGRCNGKGHSGKSSASQYDSAEARIRFNDWKPANEPPHITSCRERSTLVARAKDLDKNNELISGAHSTKLDFALGVRYRMKPTPCATTLGFTGDNAACDYADWQHMVRERFEKQMYGGRPWIDARGVHDLQGLLRLYASQDLNRGEALATIFRRRESTNAPFRTVARVIDTDMLRTPSNLSDNQLYNGNLVISEGVLMRSASAAPVGYYIHDMHPFDKRLNGAFSGRAPAQRDGSPRQNTGGPRANRGTTADPYQYFNKYSPAGRLQVVHTYQQRQPNMVRGIMQIAACMKTLRCVDRFTTAQIETAILQSLVAFTVESDIPNAVQQMLGAVQGTQMESAALKAVKEHENFRKGYRDAGNKLQIDNTIVPHLVSGERLNMQGLSMSGANFGEFMDVMFTLIARCCGISKEYLTQDWSKTNFSGARAGMLVVYRDIEQFRLRCPTVLAQAIYACWLEDSILDGQIPIPNYPDPAQAWLYFAANRQMLSGSEWRGPAKDEIDRAKVAQWFIGEQTLGVYTVERYCDEVLHTYWEDVAQQQCIEEVRWNKIRADHGLPPLPAGMLHSPSAEAVAVMGALSSENSNDNNAANNGGNNGADDEA